jgi:hypothetical protein
MRRIAEPVEVVNCDTRYREIAFLRTVTADTEPGNIPRFAGYMIRYLEDGRDGSIHERHNPHPEIFGFDQPLEFDYVATSFAERWKLAIPSTLLHVPENDWSWAHHQVQQWLSIKTRMVMEQVFRLRMINRHFTRMIGLNQRIVHLSRLMATQRCNATVWGYEDASNSFGWLSRVQADSPHLVWLAWYLEGQPGLNPSLEPVAQMRNWFRINGVGQKGWRMFLETDKLYWGTLQMYGSFTVNIFLDVMLDWIRRHERLGLPRLSPVDLGMKIFMALEGSGQGNLSCDVVVNMSDSVFTLLARHTILIDPQDGAVEEWVASNWNDIEHWLLDHSDAKLDSNQVKAGWPCLKRRIDEWACAVEQGKVKSRLMWEFSLDTYQRDQLEAVALRTNKSLWNEGRRMCHCVGQLGHLAERGNIRFFSIREAGTLKPRATLELRQSDNDSSWHVGSCLGVQNSRPATEVADFASEVALRYSEAAKQTDLEAA